MNSRLFTNSTGSDTVRNAFYLFSSEPSEILLASPFFSNDEIVTELLNRKCRVRLIVRLGPATDSAALTRLTRTEGVQIRFFTSSLFHAKLYIFGQRAALVGSANLTDSGMVSNREIAFAVGADDPSFDDLIRLFQRFWQEAEVLTVERCATYAELQKAFMSKGADPFEAEVRKKFGDCAPKGVQVGRPKPSKEKTYIESYRRVYQEFLDAFWFVEQRYKSDGRRMQPESKVPLRIEIDQFFSFIREKYTKGNSYDGEPFRHGDELEAVVDQRIKDFFSQRWNYLDNVIPEHYELINNALGDQKKIDAATVEEIFEALDVCHSIHDRLRFFSGGHATLRETFIQENSLTQLQNVLSYLLHGHGSYIDRMGSCIFDDEYQLHQFGRSAVQELYGWVNRENVPICNGRTVKALRYLGFNVVIFN